MSEKKIVSALRLCSVFSGASEQTLRGLLSCRPEKFCAGDLIYSADSFEKSIGIIVSGKVEVFGENENK